MSVVSQNRQRSVPVDKSHRQMIARAVDAALQATGREGEVSVSLVGEREIRRLNRDFRGRDEVTDVLSFALEEGQPEPHPDDQVLLLGDVVICAARAQRQALSYGHSLARELCFLAVHGTLHLLGYDHQNPEDEGIMFGLTERILAGVGLPRPEP